MPITKCVVGHGMRVVAPGQGVGRGRASRSCCGRGRPYLLRLVSCVNGARHGARAPGVRLPRPRRCAASASTTTMRELASSGWLAHLAARLLRARPRGGRLLPAHAQRDLPGHEDRRAVRRRRTGRCYEEMRRNILHIDGADHRRLRNLVNPAFTPRAADRWRPAMRELPRASCGSRSRAPARCEFVEAFAKPYPSLTIATVMGAPLEDAPRLHDWSNWIQRQFDAPSLMTERERIEQAVRRVLRLRGRAARDAPRRPRRRPHLDADRRRGGGRPALRRRAA